MKKQIPLLLFLSMLATFSFAQNSQILQKATAASLWVVAFDQGLARKLAENLDANCLSLKELHAEALYEAVKMELR